MKKYIMSVAMALTLLFGFVVAPGVTVAAAPYCGITWGSMPKTAAGDWHSLTNIRTGRHDCYDRMVFDTRGTNVGYTVRYVDQVYSDGEGRLIPLSGGAKLQIVVQAPSYDVNTGAQTYPGRVGLPLPNVNLAGYQTFRDAKFAGSYEGYTTVGLGVRARLPFRVIQLDNRIVVDVAHYW